MTVLDAGALSCANQMRCKQRTAMVLMHCECDAQSAELIMCLRQVLGITTFSGLKGHCTVCRTAPEPASHGKPSSPAPPAQQRHTQPWHCRQALQAPPAHLHTGQDESVHLRRQSPWKRWLHTVVTTPLMCWSRRSRHTGQLGSSVRPAEPSGWAAAVPSSTCTPSTYTRRHSTSGSSMENCGGGRGEGWVGKRGGIGFCGVDGVDGVDGEVGGGSR
jgi:hypothetical protein